MLGFFDLCKFELAEVVTFDLVDTHPQSPRHCRQNMLQILTTVVLLHSPI